MQYKVEMRSHITHIASVSNAVMHPRTGAIDAEIWRATGIRGLAEKSIPILRRIVLRLQGVTIRA